MTHGAVRASPPLLAFVRPGGKAATWCLTIGVRAGALFSAESDVRGVPDTAADTTWLWGRISAEGRLVKPVAEPESLYGHGPRPSRHHHSPGCTRYQMRVPASRREFGALEARLAAASDLLNVAKALPVRVATRSLRHRWSDGPLPTDLAPQNAPQRKRSSVLRSNSTSYLGGAKRTRNRWPLACL
jgi:hypothetical protein